MARKNRTAPAETDAEADEAPGQRPLWSGIIAFGLVSVPVELVSAVRADRPGLHLVDDRGEPLRREYYCPEEDRALEPDELARGYAVGDGRYVVVRDEELERLEPQKSREIDLRRFVARSEVSPLWIERSYFLAPAGGTTKAYHLLAAAMAEGDRAGIATFVMRGKEYLVAIVADRGVLRADLLRFAGEVREARGIGIPDPAKASAKRVKEAAAAIAELKRSALDPRELEDDAADKLAALAARKAARGEDVVAREEPPPESTERAIDIVELLKQRLAEERAKKPPRRRARRGG